MKEWLKTWQLPLVNEAFQSEVFFNLLFLTDITSQMLDNLYRDYMVERAEDMLSLGSNVSAYPHLSLARGQRFASKGAYISRFAPDGKLVLIQSGSCRNAVEDILVTLQSSAPLLMERVGVRRIKSFKIFLWIYLPLMRSYGYRLKAGHARG